MAQSVVAVVKTSPRRVLADTARAMRLAGYQHVIDPAADTALKVNISWHHYYPACSTTPWQLEGVIRTMLRDGYRKELIHACHNRTVVVDAHEGERANKHLPVVERYGLRNIHLYEGQEWINVREAVGALADEFLVLNKVYPKGFSIPRKFVGSNIIHLPTIKTHIFTTMTGAMKNAFGGLLNEKRHYTHEVIHETLVDLLMIQKHIHKGIFAVMDGTIAGDGPGPRCMVPHVKNVMLASADQVAIDAISAKLMGFDPMSIPFIRIAHEKGLGCGDPSGIQIVGDVEVAEENWRFVGPYEKLTFAARGQHALYWGWLRPVQKVLLQTVLQPWSYLASRLYHDGYWYNFVGKKRVARALESSWGQLFRQFEGLTPDDEGYDVPGGSTKGEIAAAGSASAQR
jgi:uncharacterized protein (DUF362 family)